MTTTQDVDQEVRQIAVGELVEGLQRRGERLPFEVGAFIALGVCEALIERPVEVKANDVYVATEGTLQLGPKPELTTASKSAQALSSVLARLLVAAGPGVPPNLIRLVEHGPQDGSWDLKRYGDELTAALIPLNRGASRRVLARLVRDAQKAQPEKVSASLKAEADSANEKLDSDLDDLLGREDPTEEIQVEAADVAMPEPVPEPEPEPEPVPEPVPAFVQNERLVAERAPDAAEEVDEIPDVSVRAALLSADVGDSGMTYEEEIDAAVEALSQPPSAEATEGEPPVAEAVTDTDTDAETDTATDAVPETVAADRGPTSEQMMGIGMPNDAPLPREGARRGRPLWTQVLVGLLSAGMIYGFFILGAAWYANTPLSDEEPAAGALIETAPSKTATPAHATYVRGTLRVSAPEGSQALLYVGRGPAVVSDLKQGVAHEFVALAEGHAPARAMVGKNARWATNDDGPLYELAIQARVLAPNETVAPLGDPLHRSVDNTAGQARVRVITTPPEMKVYRLVGVGSDMSIEGLRTDLGHEFLVSHATGRAQVVVSPSDWRRDPNTDEERFIARARIDTPTP